MRMAGCPSGSRGIRLMFSWITVSGSHHRCVRGVGWRSQHLAIVRRYIIVAPLSAFLHPKCHCPKARSGGHFAYRPTHAAWQSLCC